VLRSLRQAKTGTRTSCASIVSKELRGKHASRTRSREFHTRVSLWQPPMRSERVSWATKQSALAVVCEDRHPLTCGPLTTAACWFMKRPIARGNFTVSKNLDKVEDFLVKRGQSGA